jgi:hypothetical protein
MKGIGPEPMERNGQTSGPCKGHSIGGRVTTRARDRIGNWYEHEKILIYFTLFPVKFTSVALSISLQFCDRT